MNIRSFPVLLWSLALLVVAGGRPAAAAVEVLPFTEIEQVAEPDSSELHLFLASDHLASGPEGRQRFCQPGATWLRLHLRDLSLYGEDRLVIEGAAGDTFSFSGSAWNAHGFYTRRFAGECVTLRPSFANTESEFEIDRVQVGHSPLATDSLRIAAAGDLCGADCNRTAVLVAALDPTLFLALGDLAYNQGEAAEFNAYYDPFYGPFKRITRPTPGNHEYAHAGAHDYFDYFNGVGVYNGVAGDRDKGYYSFDLGDWHIVALNSNLAMAAESPQELWLREDLKSNSKPCTLAFLHAPRFTRANYDDFPAVRPLYQALEDAGADVILAGHDHSYQRYKKLTASGAADPVRGVRSFVVGTGGRSFYPLRADPRRDAGEANAYGVLELELGAGGYSWEFVPERGSTYSDRGSDVCHRAAG